MNICSNAGQTIMCRCWGVLWFSKTSNIEISKRLHGNKQHCISKHFDRRHHSIICSRPSANMSQSITTRIALPATETVMCLVPQSLLQHLLDCLETKSVKDGFFICLSKSDRQMSGRQFETKYKTLLDNLGQCLLPLTPE